MATTTRAPALTTPFVPEPECTSTYHVLEFHFPSAAGGASGTNVREQVLVAAPGNAKFASCQPPGWSDDGISSTLAFSPAVCPDTWHMYHITAHEEIVAGTSTKTVTTAYCCNAQDTVYPTGVVGLGIDYFSSNPACVRTLHEWDAMTFVARQSKTPFSTVTFTEGTSVQPAWQIAWEETDRAVLTPAPPILTPGQSVSVLVPGEPISTISSPQSTCSASCGLSHGDYDGIIQMIAIPSSIAFVVLVAVSVCCLMHKRNKKKKRRAAVLQAQGEGGSGHNQQ
ncbi:hypothetical protein EsH8_X_000357 [Colletotrichum jinshuiense]